MLLRELLEQIGTTYNPKLGTSNNVRAQRLLRKDAIKALEPLVPNGHTVKGSGGVGGSAATVPWIAVFNDNETSGATEGIYLVYLFAIRKGTVSLTLNQGVTAFKGGNRRRRMTEAAHVIRQRFAIEEISDLTTEIDLDEPDASLPVDYEHANIFGRTYPIRDLPSEPDLINDLDHFIRLYAHALASRGGAASSGPSSMRSGSSKSARKMRAPELKLKDDSAVRRAVRAQEQIVSRKHETLVAEYGEYLCKRGFKDVATNVHPRDLTAQSGDDHWLIEAKTVGNRPINAVRDAFSQLYFYQYFEYPDPRNVRRVALFNEPIGEALVDFLHSHDIAVVWLEDNNWVGTVPDLVDHRWHARRVRVDYQHSDPTTHNGDGAQDEQS